ncbi:hypothetical protein D049_2996A, partial [Vibrio parahaemolyticus VPTS-2010]
MNQSF